MADFKNIIYEKPADKVLRITLNRPERMNAMSPSSCTSLISHWTSSSRTLSSA